MMQPWFAQAKFGIFLHWGIYAVKGVSESWCFYRDEISHADYMKQLDGFTASKYDAKAWAAKFRQWGARYAVLTSKHHDGVALWDTQANDLSVVKKTPAGRDLIKPYCEALREAGLKVGLYYSHLDWSHPDYASVRPHDRDLGDPARLNRYSWPRGAEDPEAWRRFLKFHRAQLKELCSNYGKIDLLWFDGDPERDKAQWNMKEVKQQLLAMQPEVICNARMHGEGDYDTPEQLLPYKAPDGPWEFCMTLNGSWGYQKQDHDHKSVRMLLRYFGEVVGLGGTCCWA
jgi:alpha-L-fucosidase